MEWKRPRYLVAGAVAAALALPGAASAAGPPLPTAVNGHPVSLVATGVPTPTSFAFAGETIFAGSGPDESGKHKPTGLFTLAGGKATKVPGTTAAVAGLAWKDNVLYVSSFAKIIAYSDWNGTTFGHVKTIAKPLKVTYNGLAFGPDGRLYAGVSFRAKYDPGKDPAKYAQSVISMKTDGSDVKSVATGLRQPFQLHFPDGATHPYVGVLGQEKGKIPEDAIIVAKSGQNYGYPKCLFGVGTTCAGFAKPLITLPKHASPMGITSVGTTLYVSLFGGLGNGKPVVASVPVAGGTAKAFLKGFVAPVIALAQNGGTIYVGDLTGSIYSVAA